jgi:phosphatidate cytidylyltransferase
MHAKRWLTSIVALPFVIFMIWHSVVTFFLLISIVALICLMEYFIMVFRDKPRPVGLISLGGIFGALMIAAAHAHSPEMMLGILVLNLGCCAAVSVWGSKTGGLAPNAIGRQLQGMVYIPLLLGFLVLMRRQPYGLVWIFYLMVIIFSGDIGAYYVGTWWGKHKLNPRVSPGKTIEGALGGLGANILVGCGINFYADVLPWGLAMPKLAWGWAVLFFVVAGAIGQLGDLFESQLKRAAKIKDSGKILPGHGGLLDRVDALIFAAPVAYLFKNYVFY